MKRTVIILFALWVCTAASAQVRHIGRTPQPTDSTTAALNIQFGYDIAPSTLLQQSAKDRSAALTTTAVGIGVGGGLVALGISQMENTTSGQSPLPVLGYIVVGSCGIAAIVCEILSIKCERRAGEELRKVTISANGITYHF